MKNQKVLFRNQTNYPNLFNCYWGSFNIQNSPIKKEIFQNRNQFVQKFDIVKKVPQQTISKYHYFFTKWHMQFEGNQLDHPEMYLDKEGQVILVCSNYDYPPPKFMQMRPYGKLYHPRARTYVRIFENMQDFRKTTKQWDKDLDGYLYLKEMIRNVDPSKTVRDVVDEWKMYKNIKEKRRMHFANNPA